MTSTKRSETTGEEPSLSTEEQLAFAIEGLSEHVVLFDAQDRVILANKAWRELNKDIAEFTKPGTRFEDHLRALLAKGLVPEASDREEAWLHKRMERHLNPSGPFEVARQDGRWIRVYEQRLPNNGIILIISDITESKRAEQALRDSEERLWAVVSHSPAKVHIKDAEGRYILINPVAEELYGVTDAGARGKTNHEIFSTVQADAFSVHDQKVLETGKAIEQEEEWHREDGVHTYLTVKFPTLDFAGKVTGIGAIGTDITERKRMDEQLRESDKLYALGQLAGGVAHDFNNLLMVIGGYAKRALDAPEDDKRVHKALDEVIKATDKAGALTRQLLAFGRRQVLETSIFPASTVLQDMDTLLRPLLGETIKLSIDIADEKTCVEADSAQLSQTLVNLAINGRDAMPGGGPLKIGMDVIEPDEALIERHPGATEGPYVRMSVADAGTGMDAKTLGHIFEPFFTTKEQGKGTGLGLAMVYGFVQQSGGIIEIDSELGRGTTFTVYLPAVEQKPVIASEVERENLAGKGETILIAEDDEALRQLAVMTLEELGYKVLAAGDGFEALELETDHEGAIDLLLSDVVMPNMGGFDLAKAIEDTRPDTKVIFMSGYPGNDASIPEETTFLQKPVNPRILAQTIRDILGEPGRRTALPA